jgi:hypothetical protein
MKRSNMANEHTKKRTLSMTMEPQFDFQPEGLNEKSKINHKMFCAQIWLKLTLWDKLKVIPKSLNLNCQTLIRSFCSEGKISIFQTST